LEPFGITDGLELKVCDPFAYARAHAYARLKIRKRGSPPLGGGEVLFFCPIVKQVKTLNFVDPGKIKRIRGISYATFLLTILSLLKNPGRHAVRVSPQFSNRMIEAARSVLNRFIPDIYLYSDVYKGEESGK
jgi:RNA 3'-terminal phosphate cyclase-like protein